MKVFKLVSLILILTIGASLRTYADDAAINAKAEQIRTVSKIDDLINHLNKIVGIEAIVADGTDSAFYSRFGHAMLRFVKSDGVYATDEVVSFEADIPNYQINAIKGVLGGYRIHPEVEDFNDYWRTYIVQEQRPLMRYVIQTTPDDRARLLYNLREWARHPGLAGRYTFLKNNCVGVLAKLLKLSGLPTELGIRPSIPTHLGIWLRHSYLSPWPALRVESLKSLISLVGERLGICDLCVLSGYRWPPNAADTIEQNFSDLQIKQLLLQVSQMPFSVRNTLSPHHRFDNGGATLDQAMNFKEVPQIFYRICSSGNCVSRQLSEAKQFWGAQELAAALKDDRYVLDLAAQNKAEDPNFVPAPKDYFDNYVRLVRGR